MFDWLVHSLGAWAVAATALWLSLRGRRKAFWVWLTDEQFYKNFGFLGLLWPQRERKRVWPKVMEDAKIVYLERLEKARQYRGGRLPKWWVALVNIRFLLHMSSLIVEMARAIDLIAFLKRRSSSETAKKQTQVVPGRIINASCPIEVRAEATAVVTPRLVRASLPPETETPGTGPL